MFILKHVSLAIVVTTLIHAQPGLAFAQTEKRLIHASVIDKAGAPVTALTESDFIVREDGVQREILRVAPAADALQIAVLVDTSQAMKPHINDLRRALKNFFNQMAGEHELALVAFGERPTVLVDTPAIPPVWRRVLPRSLPGPAAVPTSLTRSWTCRRHCASAKGRDRPSW